MPYIEGSARDQQVLFPDVLDDDVDAENVVRFLDAFVGTLDLAALGFRRTTPKDTGRPPYDPGDLLCRLDTICCTVRIRYVHPMLAISWALRAEATSIRSADPRRQMRGAKDHWACVCV